MPKLKVRFIYIVVIKSMRVCACVLFLFFLLNDLYLRKVRARSKSGTVNVHSLCIGTDHDHECHGNFGLLMIV